MSNSLEILAQTRTEAGKAHARRLRHAESIPAIVYGAGQDPVTLTLVHKDINHTLKNEAAFSQILTLTIDGKSEPVVIKAIQRHVYKPKIMHVDFLRIKAKEQLTMNVPLHFINEDVCVGLKAGGILSKQFNEVEIKCLPADLPEFIEVDISALELDHSLHLSDVILPKGVEPSTEITPDHNPGIVSISKPKTQVEEEPSDEAAQEGAEEGDAKADDDKNDETHKD